MRFYCLGVVSWVFLMIYQACSGSAAAHPNALNYPPIHPYLLQAEGFSNVIIDRFFRPFLGGIFFNRQLTTSSRLFEFVMRMLATGDNCLPAQGIGALAQQLGGQLQQDSILLGTHACVCTPVCAHLMLVGTSSYGLFQSLNDVVGA